MKVLSKVLRILTLVLSIGGLALFFTEFVTCNVGGEATGLVGAQLAFGGSVGDAGALAKSLKIMFCIILAAIAAVAAGLNFKKAKASRWVNIAFTAVSGIYMLVVALSLPWEFFDFRTETGAAITNIAYTPFVLVTAIVLLAAFAAGVANLMVEDLIEVSETSGKITIPKRIVKFFREYKSEVKKIVWPGPRAVVKNTLIVLVLCAILGVFIWLLDFGLSQLIGLVITK